MSVTGAPLDADVAAAVAASHLAGLEHGLVAGLLADGTRPDAAAGATRPQVGATGPHVELVVARW